MQDNITTIQAGEHGAYANNEGGTENFNKHKEHTNKNSTQDGVKEKDQHKHNKEDTSIKMSREEVPPVTSSNIEEIHVEIVPEDELAKGPILLVSSTQTHINSESFPEPIKPAYISSIPTDIPTPTEIISIVPATTIITEPTPIVTDKTSFDTMPTLPVSENVPLEQFIPYQIPVTTPGPISDSQLYMANNGPDEIRVDNEGELPERQPMYGFVPTPKYGRRMSTFMEPPMPLEHKKDRLKHHIRLAHKKNTLGETIYKGHPSWLLMRDIQTGLYTNIKNMATRTRDFDLFHTPKVTVLPIAPNAKFTFKFKDYCPMAFYNLRERFGINHVDYVTSLCQNWNEVGTPGKSGSLFFFSLDNQYVLKTIPKREAKILRDLLPSYYEYMMKNTDSLLTRFMGLHRVKPHKGRQVRFLVMGNLFNSNLRMHMRFDLKGSTIGRELSSAERAKKNPTFKDLDFVRLNRKLHLGPNRDIFLRQIQSDCEFLCHQQIMDYSMLVGIHFAHQTDDSASSDEEGEDLSYQDPPRSPPLNRSATNLLPYVPDTEVLPPKVPLSCFEREEGGIRARLPDGTLLDEYYYVGVIDILMHYSLRKQLEHVAKRVLHPRGEISAVNPLDFAKRFMNFAVGSID